MKCRIPYKMTVQQKKAMMIELDKQISENVQKLTKNIVAIMLWQLHEQEGFGKKRLLRFHESFAPKFKELQDYYEMHSAEDGDWLCKYKLREIGIDLDKMDDILEIPIEYK